MAVVDLKEQIDNQVNPILAIVAETIQSLNYYKGKAKGISLATFNCYTSGFGVTFGVSVKHLSDFA